MAAIFYTYKNQVYANITNKCNCKCTFCIRTHENGVGDAQSLWHETEPSLEEIKKAADAFDFSGYRELVYCGYGEPTCALDQLIASASYIKAAYNIPIRINTNGLANLHHQRNVVPELGRVTDCISISLNAPTGSEYSEVTRPVFPDAFKGLLDFARECKQWIPSVQMTVVDILPADKIDASRKLAESLGIKLRIRRFS